MAVIVKPTRREPLPVTRRTGETPEAWAGRIMDAWFRLGQQPVAGLAAIQVQVANDIMARLAESRRRGKA